MIVSFTLPNKVHYSASHQGTSEQQVTLKFSSLSSLDSNSSESGTHWSSLSAGWVQGDGGGWEGEEGGVGCWGEREGKVLSVGGVKGGGVESGVVKGGGVLAV